MFAENARLKGKIRPARTGICAVFFMSACASLSGSTEEQEMLQAEKPDQAARAECMAMHEKMKSKMAGSGMQMNEGLMSPEMKARHERCMAMMNEMGQSCMGARDQPDPKAGAREKCKAMMHSPASHEHDDGQEQ